MNRVEGKVAIVTGAAGRIGSATAKALAAEGAHVVLADIDAEGAERQAESITAAGQSAISVQVDIANEASIRTMIERAVGVFGQLDVLHNNAAATGLGGVDLPIQEADPEVWRHTMQINLIGTMLGIKHALPHMLEHGRGCIINTSSNGGHLGDFSHPAYCASKAAVVALTRDAATMYGKQGIRVNAITPGMITVPDSMSDALRRIMLDNHLTARFGVPNDIAHAVVYLASDESEFVTGQIIHVDGGWSAHQPYYAQMRAAGGWPRPRPDNPS